MDRPGNTYVQLCGRFVVELYGRRVDQPVRGQRGGEPLGAGVVVGEPGDVVAQRVLAGGCEDADQRAVDRSGADRLPPGEPEAAQHTESATVRPGT